jgi:zinc protease
VQDVDDVRRLQMAARVVSTRLSETIREKKQLVYSIRATARPATEYPGFGTFGAQAPTEPAKAESLGVALEEVYAAFRKDGPTEDEMAVAKRQMANTLDEAMKTPEFWTERLQDLDYRGLRLDDVVAMPAAYQAMTGAQVRETFAKYCVPEARFRFVLVPE